jgi:pyridoxal biosynthesis lyase PdxS
MADDENHLNKHKLEIPILCGCKNLGEALRRISEGATMLRTNTPADAALMMQLGMDGVFVGSGIFKSSDPEKRARAIVQAVTHYNDAKIVAEVSRDLGIAMC